MQTKHIIKQNLHERNQLHKNVLSQTVVSLSVAKKKTKKKPQICWLKTAAFYSPVVLEVEV